MVIMLLRSCNVLYFQEKRSKCVSIFHMILYKSGVMGNIFQRTVDGILLNPHEEIYHLWIEKNPIFIGIPILSTTKIFMFYKMLHYCKKCQSNKCKHNTDFKKIFISKMILENLNVVVQIIENEVTLKTC